MITLELDQVGAKSPDACYELVYPSTDGSMFDISQYTTPEVMEQDLTSTDAVISTGAAQMGRIPSKDEVASSFAKVSALLVARFGTADVANLAKPKELDHAKACQIISFLYKSILELPVKDAGPLLRYLFAQQRAA